MNVPDELGDVEGLSLVLVHDEERRMVWNTLLHFEHPHGTATFAGCQLRYLIVSSHGILGALGGVSVGTASARARRLDGVGATSSAEPICTVSCA